MIRIKRRANLIVKLLCFLLLTNISIMGCTNKNMIIKKHTIDNYITQVEVIEPDSIKVDNIFEFRSVFDLQKSITNMNSLQSTSFDSLNSHFFYGIEWQSFLDNNSSLIPICESIDNQLLCLLPVNNSDEMPKKDSVDNGLFQNPEHENFLQALLFNQTGNKISIPLHKKVYDIQIPWIVLQPDVNKNDFVLFNIDTKEKVELSLENTRSVGYFYFVSKGCIYSIANDEKNIQYIFYDFDKMDQRPLMIPHGVVSQKNDIDTFFLEYSCKEPLITNVNSTTILWRTTTDKGLSSIFIQDVFDLANESQRIISDCDIEVIYATPGKQNQNIYWIIEKNPIYSLVEGFQKRMWCIMKDNKINEVKIDINESFSFVTPPMVDKSSNLVFIAYQKESKETLLFVINSRKLGKMVSYKMVCLSKFIHDYKQPNFQFRYFGDVNGLLILGFSEIDKISNSTIYWFRLPLTI